LVDLSADPARLTEFLQMKRSFSDELLSGGSLLATFPVSTRGLV
jgi:hypothetical protein